MEKPKPSTVAKTCMNHPQMVVVYVRSEGSGVPGVPGVPQRRLAAVALALSLSLAGGVLGTGKNRRETLEKDLETT